MLLLTVTVWPRGSSTDLKLVGCAAITNASGPAAWANYVAAVSDDTRRLTSLWIVGHRRDLGFWPLVERVVYDHTHAESRIAVPEPWEETAQRLHQRLIPLGVGRRRGVATRHGGA